MSVNVKDNIQKAAARLPQVVWRTEYQDPYRFQTADDFKRLMYETLQQGASDILFQPGLPVCAEIHGRLHAVTHRPLDDAEVQEILVICAGRANATTDIMGGNAVNGRYELFDPVEKDERGNRLRYRYRVNGSPIAHHGQISCQVVLRAIPREPPHFGGLGLNEELVRKACPEDGIVYVAGRTGSGKTTTFAAIIRFIMEHDTPIRGNLITHEEPIEFDFSSVGSAHSIIVQSQIPTHFKTFYDANSSAMRRKPGLIMIGEMRDQETIRAAIEASLTGHPVFGTVHATNVAAVMRRLISRFPEAERPTAIYDIVDSARFIMAQTLVDREGGGRVAVREWLQVDGEVRDALLSLSDMGRVTSALRELMVDKGWSFAKDAARLLSEGKISEATARRIVERSQD